MQIISANCPACGGVYDGKVTSRFITCEYCGTRFALGEEELRAMGFVDANGDGIDDHDQAPVQQAAPQDTNNDPMDVFARDACEEFLKARGVDQSSFVSSRKIERGLDISGGEIYLIHDDTMFKSGKNGFAITSAGLYCRELGERSAHFVNWAAFGQGGEPYEEDGYIKQDGRSVCYFTDNGDVLRNQLTELFQKLHRHAAKMA